MLQPVFMLTAPAFLSNPNVVFILLTIAGIGILIELLNPGTFVGGVIGVIALVLAFVGMGGLPVNWLGVALIVLAMGLFFLEMQAPGLGGFAVGGAVSFIAGAFLLFGGFTAPIFGAPGLRVSLWLIGLVSVAMFVGLFFMFRESNKARNSPIYLSDYQQLRRQIGKTTTELKPEGTVQIAGELWSAVSDNGETIAAGEQVIVSDVEGLTLKVFKADL
jgi:membrane-bound serine protease (ClpP class)